MSVNRQIFSGLKWTTIATIVTALSSILKLSILSRLLDPSDFGLMALVMFVLGFMNLFMDMGLTSAILHFQEIGKKQYASLYWLNLFFSIFLYVFLLLLTPLITIFYEEKELNILIPIMGVSLLISALGRQYKTIEQKNLNFKFIGITEIVAAIFSLGLAIVLAIEDFGVYALVYSSLLLFGISSIVFFIRGIRKKGLLFHYNYEETKPFLKIGIYQVGGQVINYFNRDLDILIIGKFFDAGVLGGYSLAKQLVFRPAQVINPVLTRVASPVLSLYQNNLAILKKNYLRLVNMVASVNIPVYVVIIVFAPFIVDIFYGKTYGHIVPLVQLLSVTMIFRAVGNPSGSLVIATGKTHLELIWNLVVLVTVPIAVVIGSYFSVLGIAVALVVSRLILFYPSWYFLVNKMIEVSFVEYMKTIVILKIPKLR